MLYPLKNDSINLKLEDDIVINAFSECHYECQVYVYVTKFVDFEDPKNFEGLDIFINNTIPPLHNFNTLYILNTTKDAIKMPEGTLIGQLNLIQLDGNKIKNFTPQYLKADVFEKIEDDLEAIFQKSSLEKMCKSLTDQLERCKTIREKKIMHIQSNKRSLK